MMRSVWLVAGLLACSVGQKNAQLPTVDTDSDALGALDVAFGKVDSNFEEGTSAYAVVELTAADGAELTLTSSIDGRVSRQDVAGGQHRLSLKGLSPGVHELVVEATAPGSLVQDQTTTAVCTKTPLVDLQTFDNGIPAGWTVYGDGSWDPGGWLEITGNVQSRKGAIFRTEEKVNPGDVVISFDIATGGGINSGADGYAVSIIDAVDEAELNTTIISASDGGCLAYGYGAACNNNVSVPAVHIEFDTWENPEYNDPTSDNHIAITFDGNPSNHVFWAAIPNLEDLQWRHVQVSFYGSNIQVHLDGTEIINGDVPGYTFDGGYIGVSGSTGWATNYHRFDNLELHTACLVP